MCRLHLGGDLRLLSSAVPDIRLWTPWWFVPPSSHQAPTPWRTRLPSSWPGGCNTVSSEPYSGFPIPNEVRLLTQTLKTLLLWSGLGLPVSSLPPSALVTPRSSLCSGLCVHSLPSLASAGPFASQTFLFISTGQNEIQPSRLCSDAPTSRKVFFLDPLLWP